MSNNFWTDDRVADFAQNWLHIQESASFDLIEQFKSSKTAKDWEVVAFKCDGSLFTKRDAENEFSDGKSIMTLSYGFNPANNCTIHAIRRLSDGLEFEFDELVKTPYHGKHKIRGFKICENYVMTLFDFGELNLKFLTKLPQPLFVTTDGKELLEKDEFWPMDKKFTLYSCAEYASELNKEFYKNHYTFSTREAAETYVFENKPSLSIRDLRELVNGFLTIHPDDKQTIISWATELIKSKNK